MIEDADTGTGLAKVQERRVGRGCVVVHRKDTAHGRVEDGCWSTPIGPAKVRVVVRLEVAVIFHRCCGLWQSKIHPISCPARGISKLMLRIPFELALFGFHLPTPRPEKCKGQQKKETKLI